MIWNPSLVMECVFVFFCKVMYGNLFLGGIRRAYLLQIKLGKFRDALCIAGFSRRKAGKRSGGFPKRGVKGARFKRHNRFAHNLWGKQFLIADNVHIAASRERFPGVILKCRCRILFTTRSRYENHISLELAAKFFPEAGRAA